MEKTVYVLIEQGAGILHKVFECQKDAEIFLEILKEQSGYDCYEVQEIFFKPTSPNA